MNTSSIYQMFKVENCYQIFNRLNNTIEKTCETLEKAQEIFNLLLEIEQVESKINEQLKLNELIEYHDKLLDKLLEY